jgi:hypothetical protein
VVVVDELELALELFFEPQPAATTTSEVTASASSASRRGLLIRTFSFLGGAVS